MAYKDKEKNKEAFKRWYEKNKDIQIQRVKLQRERNEKEVREYKEKNPCLDCKKFYPYYVMDFDHINENKITNVSSLIKRGSRKQIWEEINKCELVCSNCHRERTHKRGAWASW